MLGRYLGVLLLTFGWLALTGGNHADSKRDAEQIYALEPVADALHNIAAIEDQQAKRTEILKETEPCRRGEDRRYSDLCAQWKAADAAADSAWWAWAGSVISILGLVGVLAAVGVSVWSNLIVRSTAKHELRAYLGVREVRAATDGEDHISARVIIQNYGSTPAHNVTATIRGWVGDFPSQVLDGSHPVPEDFICPNTVHPGAEFDLYASDSVPNVIDILNGDKGFYVYGSVNYVDFDGEDRTTGFCYRGTENTLISKGQMRVSFEGNDAT